MDPIPSASYIDSQGVDNLIIPIAVGEPVLLPNKSYTIDVVIHSEIVQRIRPTHHLFDHLLSKITALVMQWVAQETGLRADIKTTKYHASCPVDIPKKSEGPTYEDLKKAMADLSSVLKEETSQQTPSPFLFEAKEEATKPTCLIQEVNAPPKGLKKGFLAQSKGSLYGAGGSTEGRPPPPSDPLAFIPEGLRSKCTIVDTREAGEATQSRNKANERPKAIWSHEVQDNAGAMVVTIQLPQYILSAADLDDISITQRQININYDQYIVKLNKDFDHESAVAKFNKKQQCLIITCPL
eukprot:GILI01021643.1.p1 GENE.GILI01021643.1~~GILI01021643.1.p1  ORF type:complete len:332 (+),score=23.26 GILI01021643.1:111-998(+)